MKRLIPALVFLLVAAAATPQTSAPKQPGPLSGGGFLLNTGWVVKPAGTQVPLDTFPMSAVLSKDGKYLLVLNAGYNQPSITVLDVKSMRPVGSVSLPDAWLGMSFTPDGKTLYVGGASQACIYALSFSADGQLTLRQTFPVVDPAKRQPADFIGDVTTSPDGHLIYAAALYKDAIVVVNPQSGRVIETWKTARRPYRILFEPDGKTFLVTGWADGSLHLHDANTGDQLLRVPLGPHPTDMVWSERKPEGQAAADATWRARLFVSVANSNKVLVLAVSDTNDIHVTGTLNVSLHSINPLGMTPSALALSSDGGRLYVVCSDANAVAVANLLEAFPRVAGFVPSGWYPTAAAALPDGRLVILNGRGSRSFPNPDGPRPQDANPAKQGESFVGRLLKGTASVVPALDAGRLDDYSRQVLENSPYDDKKLFDAGVPEANPVPTRQGEMTPIKYVVYILKEGRSYDQVLGDLEKNGKPLGNGDEKLATLGSAVTPNHHKLASEFVVLDNFYANGDAAPDGEHWSAASIANDYVQKLWANSYAGRLPYDNFEGPELADAPPAGYLWTNAVAAGVSIRNYGWWTENLEKPAPDGRQVRTVTDPVLARYTNMNFRGPDLNYRDVDRAKVFIG